MTIGLKSYIAKVASGASLSFEEAKEAFGIIMSGDATPGQIGGFLMALRTRGETVDEIAMNPTYFAVTPLVETMQTLVHEMAHLGVSSFSVQ